ncbi:MAG: Gfo/Idh/MocA family oxidoreductase [Chloroflexi bacterium]|nr:Gfo/Idh/MocA family oxidoreductase [Chloroflexota bacterium]
MRLAVVGCGAIALEAHLPAVRKIRGVELVAVVDKDLSWTAEVARRFGAREAVTDYRELVGRVDAAIVATPNWNHVQITCDLLQLGINVLCEKPLALSSADAARVFATAEAGGARVMAGHSRRFTSSAQALRSLVQIGAFGHVDQVNAAMGAPIEQWRSRDGFRSDPRLSGGGCLMDSGIHLIDMVLWLMGRPAQVSDYRSSEIRGWGVEDDATLTLTLPGGAVARLASSYTHELSFMFNLSGSHGWASMPLNGAPGAEFVARAGVLGRRAAAQQVAIGPESPHLVQLRHFCSCLQTGQPFLVEQEEVLEGLRIIEACYSKGADYAA